MWAAANWLLDAASLWAFVAAYGHFTAPIDLFVAYGVANVLAAVPLTPGGLGIVEAVAATSLIGFGVPAGIAWLGVISWRLFNFWLPIPVGAGAYLSLRVSRGAGLKERRRRARGHDQGPGPDRPPDRRGAGHQAETSLLGGPGLQLLRPRRHHLKADRDLEQLLEEQLLALQHPALELGLASRAHDDLDRRAAQLDADVTDDRVVGRVEPVGDAQQGEQLQHPVPVLALREPPRPGRTPVGRPLTW